MAGLQLTVNNASGGVVDELIEELRAAAFAGRIDDYGSFVRVESYLGKDVGRISLNEAAIFDLVPGWRCAGPSRSKTR